LSLVGSFPQLPARQARECRTAYYLTENDPLREVSFKRGDEVGAARKWFISRFETVCFKPFGVQSPFKSPVASKTIENPGLAD
jgi:hypothetical protein